MFTRTGQQEKTRNGGIFLTTKQQSKVIAANLYLCLDGTDSLIANPIIGFIFALLLQVGMRALDTLCKIISSDGDMDVWLIIAGGCRNGSE
mmetsp:Transcript_27405/g.42014  ORF Transcript_27405/g.42014 Transcript_27405/m.42014 type:complete len:91 (-) Transcript_27405:42-314(-)